MKYKKVIFVSKDGTYRAPIATSIMQKIVGKEMKVEARGLVVLFPEPINPKGMEAAMIRGYSLVDTTSHALEEKDFNIENLILVMTEKIKQQVYDNFEKAVNVYSLKEFAGGQGDIDSPFGKGVEEYIENFEILNEWVQKAAKLLD